MFTAWAGAAHDVDLTLYTDAFVIRGRIRTAQRRITDILNYSDTGFLVLSDARFEALGERTKVNEAPYAQVNLDAVLFAVTNEPPEPAPEFRTRRAPERALVSIPPFEVAGTIHLVPEHELRDALQELRGRFVPVTSAEFWSDQLGEPRTNADMVAVNRARAQILSPYGSVSSGGSGGSDGSASSGRSDDSDSSGGSDDSEPAPRGDAG